MTTANTLRELDFDHMLVYFPRLRHFAVSPPTQVSSIRGVRSLHICEREWPSKMSKMRLTGTRIMLAQLSLLIATPNLPGPHPQSKEERRKHIRQDSTLACSQLGRALRVDHQVLSFEVMSEFYESCTAAKSWSRVGEWKRRSGKGMSPCLFCGKESKRA